MYFFIIWAFGLVFSKIDIFDRLAAFFNRIYATNNIFGFKRGIDFIFKMEFSKLEA